MKNALNKFGSWLMSDTGKVTLCVIDYIAGVAIMKMASDTLMDMIIDWLEKKLDE